MPRFVPPSAAAARSALGFPPGTPIPLEFTEDPALFPPPTVLPGDDLHGDPEYPPQPFTEFRDDPDRAHRTAERKTICLVRLCGCAAACACDVYSPPLGAIAEYVGAYYLGLAVRVLPPLRLEAWAEPRKQKRARVAKAAPAAPASTYVAVRTPTTLVRVRTRTPSLDGFFTRQLHVSDVLDACADTLPADAFAILCVTPEDIFDQDDDDEEDNLFTCGRAYGGSRIACVSAARYRPSLDTHSGVLARLPKGVGASPHAGGAPAWPHGSRHPHAGAVAAAAALPPPASAAVQLQDWLSRVCKTAAHELGHCAGLDHCCYHACAMQVRDSPHTHTPCGGPPPSPSCARSRAGLCAPTGGPPHAAIPLPRRPAQAPRGDGRRGGAALRGPPRLLRGRRASARGDVGCVCGVAARETRRPEVS